MAGEITNSDMYSMGHHLAYRSRRDQRSHPRQKLRVPVQIGLPDGQVVCAGIYNMSPDGVQIRCEATAALLVNPSGRAVEPGAGPLVQVAMRLNTGIDLSTIVVRARVSYVLPESPNEVIIGMSFETLNRNQRDVVDAALSASLNPRNA